jgi:transcriptional regulator with XRE-family HTH domain
MPTGTPSIPATALGARLRDLRTRAGLTQWEMANEMKTRANRISDWETGRYEPSLPVLKRFAEVYGMTVSGLLQRIM